MRPRRIEMGRAKPANRSPATSLKSKITMGGDRDRAEVLAGGCDNVTVGLVKRTPGASQTG